MKVPVMVPASEELGTAVSLRSWLKKAGDRVKKGEVLAEVEADKGVIEIEALADGTLGDIAASEGDSLAPGAVIGYVESV
ncbi:MAG: hypothetical protein E4H36_02495 [Spirochaetales bacterium]|nr:MAG: hypothetical protein E4H36_02495 [Spirochaetales bacterium]